MTDVPALTRRIPYQAPGCGETLAEVNTMGAPPPSKTTLPPSNTDSSDSDASAPPFMSSGLTKSSDAPGSQITTTFFGTVMSPRMGQGEPLLVKVKFSHSQPSSS